MRNFLLFLLLVSFSLPILSQNRAQTESRFVYPDRMRIYDSVMAARIPQLNVQPGNLKTSLPAYIDNSQTPFFPGILNQYQFFTCQQFAGVAYTYAYEINRMRNRPGIFSENRYSTHYTWTFMNDGDRYKGVSFFYSWDLIRQQGIPAISDFGTDTLASFTGWMSGYTKYLHGMHNRLKNIWSVPINTEQGILTLKNYLFDHLDGSSTGGVACFSASANYQPDNLVIIPPGLPEEGLNLLLAFYPRATHGLTIVGYNDSIRYDINNDGLCTNNLDINGDGIVNLKDHEIGAWILANSYGNWWANQGYFYALYRALALDYDDGTGNWQANNGVWNHCVYIVESDPDYEPLLTAKVNLTYNYRNKIRVKAGISADTSQQIPEHILEFPIFSFQGGPYPMKGFDTLPSDAQIEFGLDITPLLSYAEPGKPSKFFIMVEERDPEHGGQGLINNVSFFDYAGGVNEIGSKQTEVPVLDNNTTFVSAAGTINFDKVQVATEFLPAYVPGEVYEHSLQASGGNAPFRWSLVRPVIKEETDSVFQMASDMVLHPFSTYIPYAKFHLPFRFPFNGNYYDTIYVNAYGFISFDSQMLPYPYLTDEEGMIRRNKVISPAFAINFLVDPVANQIWVKSLPGSVCIRWKLAVTDHENESENNFALRLYSDGTFEFLYGNILNQNFSFVTHSGYSAGDENNYETWSNWDFNELAGKSFFFRPSGLPDSISVSAEGLLRVSGADTSVIYQLPVRVTDAKGISSVRQLDFSTGLQVLYDIVSPDGHLEFGEPASLYLTVTNSSQETLHDLVLHLSSPDSSLQVTDSLKVIPLLGPGATLELDSSFSFMLSCELPDQYPMPFSIRASCPAHTWIKDFRVPVSSFDVQVASPLIEDGYDGLLDPGEVADLVIHLTNTGSLGITGIQVHLSPQDTLVSVLSDPEQVLDNLSSYGYATLRFQVKASQQATPGQPAELVLSLEKQPGLNMEVPVHLQLGKFPVALISMSDFSDSPGKMGNALDSMNILYNVLDTIPPDLDAYSAVFLILGTVSPGSHALTQKEGVELAGYLTRHGNLYMESYHTWYFGEKTAVHPYFAYTSDRVPLYRYTDIAGISGTFAQGMAFSFTGAWNFSVFDFLPVTPAYSVFSNPESFSLEIAHADSEYRTIGTFVEFGKLADSTEPSTRGSLMKKYLQFFGISLSGPHALFHSDKTTIHSGDQIGFYDDSFSGVTSWQWEFPGGNPSVSTEQNPVVTYSATGKNDVKLTVSDGTNSASILKKDLINVIPGLGIAQPEQPGFFTLYPNPAEGLIHLAFRGESRTDAAIRLFDIMGRNILLKNIQIIPGSGNLTLDLSNLQRGIYILQVTTGSGSQAAKIILR